MQVQGLNCWLTLVAFDSLGLTQQQAAEAYEQTFPRAAHIQTQSSADAP
jgi:hypothetical protein